MKKIMKRLIALLCVVVMMGVIIPAELLPVVAQENQEDDLKKVLTSCDSRDENSNIATTGTNGQPSSGNPSDTYVQEGKASLGATTTLSESATNTLYNIYLSSAVDVRGYKYFNCKLYLSDMSKLKQSGTALGIVLSPKHGDSNNNSLQFKLYKLALEFNSSIS